MPEPAGSGRPGRAAAHGKAGAVAFSRSCEPALGEFEPAVVLAVFGEVPTDWSVL